MAKSRFPGKALKLNLRKRIRFRADNQQFTSEELRSLQIKRGLQLFRNIFGDSDEEDEFEGFIDKIIPKERTSHPSTTFKKQTVVKEDDAPKNLTSVNGGNTQDQDTITEKETLCNLKKEQLNKLLEKNTILDKGTNLIKKQTLKRKGGFKKFILPSVSLRSSRVITPNKRLFSDITAICSTKQDNEKSISELEDGSSHTKGVSLVHSIQDEELEEKDEVCRSISLYTDSITEEFRGHVGRPPKRLSRKLDSEAGEELLSAEYISPSKHSKEVKVKEKIEKLLRSPWDNRLKISKKEKEEEDSLPSSKNIIRKARLNLNKKTLQKIRSPSSIQRLVPTVEDSEELCCSICKGKEGIIQRYSVPCCSICDNVINELIDSPTVNIECIGSQGECQLVGLSIGERCPACWLARVLSSCTVPSLLHDRLRSQLPYVVREKIPTSFGRNNNFHSFAAESESNDYFKKSASAGSSRVFGSIVDLPGGWKRKIGNKVTVISPSGKKFKSISKLEDYLKRQGVVTDARVLFGHSSGKATQSTIGKSSCKSFLRSDNKVNVVVTTLPGGWSRRIKWRVSGNRFDTYVCSPDGRTFRSRKELSTYFQQIGKIDDIYKYFPLKSKTAAGVNSSDNSETSTEPYSSSESCSELSENEQHIDVPSDNEVDPQKSEDEQNIDIAFDTEVHPQKDEENSSCVQEEKLKSSPHSQLILPSLLNDPPLVDGQINLISFNLSEKIASDCEDDVSENNTISSKDDLNDRASNYFPQVEEMPKKRKKKKRKKLLKSDDTPFKKDVKVPDTCDVDKIVSNVSDNDGHDNRVVLRDLTGILSNDKQNENDNAHLHNNDDTDNLHDSINLSELSAFEDLKENEDKLITGNDAEQNLSEDFPKNVFVKKLPKKKKNCENFKKKNLPNETKFQENIEVNDTPVSGNDIDVVMAGTLIPGPEQLLKGPEDNLLNGNKDSKVNSTESIPKPIKRTKKNSFTTEQFGNNWSRKIKWIENGEGTISFLTSPTGQKISSSIELLAYFKKAGKPIRNVEFFFPPVIKRSTKADSSTVKRIVKNANSSQNSLKKKLERVDKLPNTKRPYRKRLLDRNISIEEDLHSASPAGPRVKHVCRSQAQVLGIPRAVFPSPEKTNENETEIGDGPTKINKKWCNKCVGCLVANCQKCSNCLDMKKFGGPGTRRKSCIRRRCFAREDASRQSNNGVLKTFIPNKTEKLSNVASLEKLAPEIVNSAPHLYSINSNEIEGEDCNEILDVSEHIMEENERNPLERSVFVPRLFHKTVENKDQRMDVPEGKEITPGTQINIDYWQGYEAEEMLLCGFPIITSGLSNLDSYCFRCGSKGKEELLYCAFCCEGVHPFCLEEGEGPESDLEEALWVCKRCTVCHVCGSPGHDSLLQCSSCGMHYHLECLGPSSHFTCQSSFQQSWLCVACSKCSSCGNPTVTNWIDVPDKEQREERNVIQKRPFCRRCLELRNHENFCPLCIGCYEDDDFDSKMMQCGRCSQWIHAHCEGISDEYYQILSFLPDSVEYICKLCLKEKRASWLDVVMKEMYFGMDCILEILNSCKFAKYLFQRGHFLQSKDYSSQNVAKIVERHNDVKLLELVDDCNRPENSTSVTLSVSDVLNSDKRCFENNTNNVGKIEQFQTKAESKVALEISTVTENTRPFTRSFLKENSLVVPTVRNCSVRLQDVICGTAESKPLNNIPPSGLNTEVVHVKEIDSNVLSCEERSNANSILPSSDMYNEMMHTKNIITPNMKISKDIDDDCISSEESSFCGSDSDIESIIDEVEDPTNFHDIKDKIKKKVYKSVLQFHVDVLRLLDGSNKNINKIQLKTCKTMYLKKLKDCFPWFDTKNINIFSLINEDRPLPIPYNDHLYLLTDSSSKSLTNSLLPKRSCFQNESNPEEVPVTKDERKCILCNINGDDDPNVSGRLLYLGQDEWIHVNCGLWSSEVYEEEDGGLQNVYVSVSRGKQIKCSLCQERGATVGCCHKSCQVAYHFLCARKAECFFMEDKRMYCLQHSSSPECDGKKAEDFKVSRCVYVNMDSEKKRWKRVISDRVNIAIGSLTIHKLGKISSNLDCPEALIPADFVCSRLYWSTKDPSKKVRYTIQTKCIFPSEADNLPSDLTFNKTIDHSAKDHIVQKEINIVKKWLKKLEDQQLARQTRITNIIPPHMCPLYQSILARENKKPSTNEEYFLVDNAEVLSDIKSCVENLVEKVHKSVEEDCFLLDPEIPGFVSPDDNEIISMVLRDLPVGNSSVSQNTPCASSRQSPVDLDFLGVCDVVQALSQENSHQVLKYNALTLEEHSTDTETLYRSFIESCDGNLHDSTLNLRQSIHNSEENCVPNHFTNPLQTKTFTGAVNNYFPSNVSSFSSTFNRDEIASVKDQESLKLSEIENSSAYEDNQPTNEYGVITDKTEIKCDALSNNILPSYSELIPNFEHHYNECTTSQVCGSSHLMMQTENMENASKLFKTPFNTLDAASSLQITNPYETKCFSSESSLLCEPAASCFNSADSLSKGHCKKQVCRVLPMLSSNSSRRSSSTSDHSDIGNQLSNPESQKGGLVNNVIIEDTSKSSKKKNKIRMKRNYKTVIKKYPLRSGFKKNKPYETVKIEINETIEVPDQPDKVCNSMKRKWSNILEYDDDSTTSVDKGKLDEEGSSNDKDGGRSHKVLKYSDDRNDITVSIVKNDNICSFPRKKRHKYHHKTVLQLDGAADSSSDTSDAFVEGQQNSNSHTSLALHIKQQSLARSTPGDEGPYKCSKCKRLYRTRDSYNKHVETCNFEVDSSSTSEEEEKSDFERLSVAPDGGVINGSKSQPFDTTVSDLHKVYNNSTENISISVTSSVKKSTGDTSLDKLKEMCSFPLKESVKINQNFRKSKLNNSIRTPGVHRQVRNSFKKTGSKECVEKTEKTDVQTSSGNGNSDVFIPPSPVSPVKYASANKRMVSPRRYTNVKLLKGSRGYQYRRAPPSPMLNSANSQISNSMQVSQTQLPITVHPVVDSNSFRVQTPAYASQFHAPVALPTDFGAATQISPVGQFSTSVDSPAQMVTVVSGSSIAVPQGYSLQYVGSFRDGDVCPPANLISYPSTPIVMPSPIVVAPQPPPVVVPQVMNVNIPYTITTPDALVINQPTVVPGVQYIAPQPAVAQTLSNQNAIEAHPNIGQSIIQQHGFQQLGTVVQFSHGIQQSINTISTAVPIQASCVTAVQAISTGTIVTTSVSFTPPKVTSTTASIDHLKVDEKITSVQTSTETLKQKPQASIPPQIFCSPPKSALESNPAKIELSLSPTSSRPVLSKNSTVRTIATVAPAVFTPVTPITTLPYQNSTSCSKSFSETLPIAAVKPRPTYSYRDAMKESLIERKRHRREILKLEQMNLKTEKSKADADSIKPTSKDDHQVDILDNSSDKKTDETKEEQSFKLVLRKDQSNDSKFNVLPVSGPSVMLSTPEVKELRIRAKVSVGPKRKKSQQSESNREFIIANKDITHDLMVNEQLPNLNLNLNSAANSSNDPTLFEKPQTASPEPYIVFELVSEDGFKVESRHISEVWQKVFDAVTEARESMKLNGDTAGSRDIGKSGSMSGLHMLGLTHNAVQYLLEQLPGSKDCHRYSFQFHRRPKEAEIIKENTSGCARTEAFKTRSPYDIFSWLASKHRKLPQRTPILYEDVQLSVRRATSLELPMAMRYRHLCETAREAVGVFRSNIHGRGLFCKRDIDSGEMVIEYSGQVIRSNLCDMREKYYESRGIGCYMFRIDEENVIDATMHGNAARFINHSCDPNCYSRVVDILGKKHIIIFALRRILRGEELTYDYKFPIEEDKIPCTCRTRRCRKYLN